MADIRKPPVEAVFALHLPRKKGKCRWCGKPVTESSRHVWHAACEAEFRVIIDPTAARRAMERRDHGVCCACGEDWNDRYRAMAGAVVWIADDGASWFASQPHPSLPHAASHYAFTLLRKVSLWHVDHDIPLWKVVHMPALQRIEYFKLANMKTRCEPCHKVKSRREEAEKAKMDHQAGEGRKDRPKRQWGQRRMNQPWRDNTKRLEDL